MAIGKDKIRRDVTYKIVNWELINKIAKAEGTTVSKIINILIEEKYNK